MTQVCSHVAVWPLGTGQPLAHGGFVKRVLPQGPALMRLLVLITLLVSMLPGVVGAVGLLAGWERVVICRGDALVVVTLDAEGRPVEVEETGMAPCLPLDAQTPVFGGGSAPRYESYKLPRDVGDAPDFVITRSATKPPGRAPPVRSLFQGDVRIA